MRLRDALTLIIHSEAAHPARPHCPEWIHTRGRPDSRAMSAGTIPFTGPLLTITRSLSNIDVTAGHHGSHTCVGLVFLMIGYILYAIMVAGLLISPAGLILACACHVRKKHVQAYLLLRISLILAGSAISIYVLRGVSVIYMMADNFTGLSASEIRTRNQLMAAACVPFLTGLTALAGPRFRLSRVVGRMLLTLPLFAIAQAWLAFLVDPDRSWEIHALIHGLLVYFTASCLLWVAVECSYRASLLEKTETAKKPDLNSAE